MPVMPRLKVRKTGFAWRSRVAQQKRGQRRRQGKRIEGRERNRERNGESKLLIEPAGGSRKQRHRHEDRNQHDGSCDDRAGNFAHRDRGGAARVVNSLFQMPLHIFNHHDGVIDHQSGRQRNAEERQRVDGKVEELDEREGPNQRDRNGHRGNQRAAPGLQEAEDHDDDDQDRYHRASSALR